MSPKIIKLMHSFRFRNEYFVFIYVWLWFSIYWFGERSVYWFHKDTAPKLCHPEMVCQEQTNTRKSISFKISSKYRKIKSNCRLPIVVVVVDVDVLYWYWAICTKYMSCFTIYKTISIRMLNFRGWKTATKSIQIQYVVVMWEIFQFISIARFWLQRVMAVDEMRIKKSVKWDFGWCLCVSCIIYFWRNSNRIIEHR